MLFRSPHVTLAYTRDADLAELTDRVGPVTFDAVRLAFGDEVYDVPLGEGAVLVDRHDGETLYASDRAAPHEDGE